MIEFFFVLKLRIVDYLFSSEWQNISTNKEDFYF